ncbi:MAG: carboxylesterase family protein [Pseudomonadales bacterium]
MAGRAAGRTLLWILLAALAGSGCSPQRSAAVSTSDGDVQGVIEDGVRVFRGIPYAEAPVGDLRWRAPRPAPAWDGVREVTDYGPACWQATDAGDAMFLNALAEGSGMPGYGRWLITTLAGMAAPEVSEDCLYLNVVAPVAPAEALPVMVWIHGGGHQFGSANPYESHSLPARGVVLVTINYRLGLYGFLAHPQLAAEDAHGSSGNYGMLDQIAALQWVQANIAAFGGDPDNVTIFGESAGGHSVGQLMVSPPARGLFHRAIAQSGIGFYQFQAMDQAIERDSGFGAGRRVAELAGVTGDGEIEALRKLSTEALRDVALNPEVSETFHPQIDGFVLPESTALAFAAGREAPVPLIVGSNADEGSVLYHFGLTPVDGAELAQPQTVAEWDALLDQAFGPRAGKVALAYGVDGDADVVSAAELLMADSWFGRHAYYAAERHARNGFPTYLYFYERRPPSPDQTIGASHALEIAHVFGTPMLPFWPTDGRDIELTGEMQSHWVQFARTGDPNAAGLAAWRPFTELAPGEMAFGHDRSGYGPVLRRDRYLAMGEQFAARERAAAVAALPASSGR